MGRSSLSSPAKRLILISGDSGAGKSWLAEKLLSNYAFSVLHLDSLYAEFVEIQVPTLFFPSLKKYVKSHYDYILSKSDYAREKFGRDFAGEWREFVVSRIIQRLESPRDRFAVEGYLLWDCSKFVEAKLSKRAAVFSIVVRNKRYYRGRKRLSIDQVASLGSFS